MESQAITQMIISGSRDLQWFDANLSRLKNEYNNNFIAFHKEKIIDADPNLENLIDKLKSKGVNLSEVLIKFVSKIKAIL